MIEEGGFALVDVLTQIPGLSVDRKAQGEKLYHEILAMAFSWKREGKIYEIQQQSGSLQRIPFKERTLEAGGAQSAIYHAFIDMMADQEKQAVVRRDYEAATLWRDAVYKIEHKTDIFEAVHAVDLLRTKLPNEQVEATLDRYTAEYRRIRGGQPEQRSA